MWQGLDVCCRYFTWDKYKFSHPEEMINNVSASGRKMVTIIDPHIKRDEDFALHKLARERGFYIKNKDGNDYEGWCWPG
jgi:alpha 1,3-glucosidase